MRIAYRTTLEASTCIPRHGHARPYATLVLSGLYEEAGENGRYQVLPGNVVVHGPFSSHCDRVGPRDAQVMDLQLEIGSHEAGQTIGVFALDDFDEVVRTAEKDAREAIHLLRCDRPRATSENDLPDMLARDLANDVGIGDWAADRGAVRETLSRQFKRLYGTSPVIFRAEARARRAWQMIVGSEEPLASIAFATGHADQSHMTRAVRSLTGAPPSAWRHASHGFKTTG